MSMANLIAPASFVNVYAFCIDDSLPKFKPDNWIKKNKLYKLKYITESLNTSEMAVTIMDNNGNEINPTETIKAFKSERFDFFQIILN
jgi:predicted transglutaminase-like protease